MLSTISKEAEHGVHLKIFAFIKTKIVTLRFITGTKLQLGSSNEIILWLGAPHIRNCIKGSQ